MVLSDKETKQRKRFQTRYPTCPQRAVLFMGAPKARCSPEPRMFEPLLLANPDIDTLRHQCSRASTICPGTSTAPPVSAAAAFRELAAWSAWWARLLAWFSGSREFPALFLGRLATWFDVRTNSVGGLRDSAGCSSGRFSHWWRSVGYLCSEKEGFTHPWLLRAPFFWGTHESKLHAVDT